LICLAFFRAGNRDQSLNDAATVGSIVRGYIKRPQSIILAVVSAKSDFALQLVTELAKELDSAESAPWASSPSQIP